jgi:hypothetical protein
MVNKYIISKLPYHQRTDRETISCLQKACPGWIDVDFPEEPILLVWKNGK